MTASLPIAPPASLTAALRNIGKGLYMRTARMAGYRAAVPTNTTTPGTRFGSNPNSTVARIQAVAMGWTAEDVFKNSSLGAAYILQRINYCSAMMRYIPATGDTGLDKAIKSYLHGEDGFGGVFGSMGVDCSMQDAFSRSADIECPIRGDSGMILWQGMDGDFRLIEFSADQLGEPYNFTNPRLCSLSRKPTGEIYETNGSDCHYFAGRYFRGPDCVAYKIYERNNSWYGKGVIYDASDVIYFRDPASFRGVRGVTKFATAILHMEKGERLFQIGMDAALRQAKTFGRVYNDPGAAENAELSHDSTDGGRYTFFEKIPSGPIEEYHFTGDQAEFVSPTAPGQSVIDGVETSDERVALALGLPYAFLISATKVGGAPSRLEVNKATTEFARIQNMIHRPRLSMIRNVVLLNAMRKGIFPMKSEVLNGRFMLPISPTVDAFYDVKASIAMQRAGLESADDIISATNRDPDEVLMKGKEWAIKCSKARQDANKQLKSEGYEADITPADIAAVSDNPAQAAQSEQIESGKAALPEPKNKPEATAKLAEWDESKHPRADDGKFWSGIQSQTTTQDEDEAIESYQDGSYQEINSALREGWSDELEDWQKGIIKDLDSALSKNTLPHDAILFRSGIPRETLLGLRNGDVLSDDGFQSTSFSSAKDSTTDIHFGKTLVEIHAKKGTNGIYVSGGEKGYDSEKEFLLPRRVRLKFKGMNGRRFVFDAESP